MTSYLEKINSMCIDAINRSFKSTMSSFNVNVPSINIDKFIGSPIKLDFVKPVKIF